MSCDDMSVKDSEGGAIDGGTGEASAGWPCLVALACAALILMALAGFFGWRAAVWMLHHLQLPLGETANPVVAAVRATAGWAALALGATAAAFRI